MKSSARVASIFIILFFFFFNGLQVYLIIERIAEAKSKFGAACSTSLMNTLADYHKLKAIDSASTPAHALVAYSKEQIEVSRSDSQHLQLSVSYASIGSDSVSTVYIESILNTPAFQTIDMELFNRLFQKSLQQRNVHSAYRLDTLSIAGRRFDRKLLLEKWEKKKDEAYVYSTNPMRLPYNSSIFILSQHKRDAAFIRNDLLLPMLAFAAILLIGNAALLFVYRTIRKQKRSNEVKTDFINNITHEMKTPITIALAGMQALEHHVPAGEPTGFYLDTSKRQLHLLNQFVERILEAAVQDVSEITLKKERIDLHAMFEGLIRSHSVLRGKPVDFSLDENWPVYIQGDRLHLETAFHNIIDNAIKYSHASVKIQIDLVENNRECVIRIRDNGLGIPQQYLKKVFEKFFRVPQGDAQSVKGFGLGLSYVSSIIKKHGGSIVVQSKEGEGTEFKVTIPK